VEHNTDVKAAIATMAERDSQIAASLKALGVHIDERRTANLLKQEGLSRAQYGATVAREQDDPRVQQAVKDLEAGIAQLSNEIVAAGLNFTVEAFADRRRVLAGGWNEAIAHTSTIQRYCERCCNRIPPKYRNSRFCCLKCKRAAFDKLRDRK
jgi:hypothetical protein